MLPGNMYTFTALPGVPLCSGSPPQGPHSKALQRKQAAVRLHVQQSALLGLLHYRAHKKLSTQGLHNYKQLHTHVLRL